MCGNTNISTQSLDSSHGSADRQTASSQPSARTLIDVFKGFADSPAEFIVHDDGYRRWSYSYRQIAAAACAFEARLRDEAIAKGDKILFWSENRPEWLVAFWGCVIRGVVVVPVDYRASADLVRNIQQVVHARVILVGEEVKSAALGSATPVWRLSDVSISTQEHFDSADHVSPSDVAEIVFTSGSTGTPKGVIITHRNIIADLDPIEAEVKKYRGYVRPLFPIRLLNLLPLSHMFGQALATFFPPMLPAVVVFMHSIAPKDVAQQIRARRVSFLVAVPKMLEVLKQYVVARCPDLANVEVTNAPWLVRRWRYRKVHRLFGAKFFGFVVGGAPLDQRLEEFWRQLGFLVVQGYGLTETAPIVSFNHPFHLKPKTVGRPLAGVAVRIASDGEILVRGEVVTPGYLSAPAEASEAFEDGWFHTGDIGAIDEDGYLVVRGRKKEMIVTPEGLKVFPEDVELILNGIPGIRDSAVVGRERVHAVLVLEPGVNAEDVVRRANAVLEEHQKVRGVSVWTAGDLPRTEGTGKLRHAAIQRWVDGGAAPVTTSMPGEIAGILQKYAPARTITPDTTVEELGLTSLEQVELLVELEERFNTTIDEALFRTVQRVGDLVRQISKPALLPEETSFIDWNRRLPARLVRRVALVGIILPLTHLCARIRVIGSDNLRSVKSPVIFASNHQSHLDTAMILAALPRRWRPLIAPAMWKEFFDAHFHPQQHSFVRRLTSSLNFYLATLLFNAFLLPQVEAGVRETVRHIGELVSEGWSVLIFPEGERTITGEIKTFQAGIGMIGARMRVPVVPVRLRGVDRVLPRGSRMIHPGAVEVTFGAPLELKGDDYTALAHKVEAAVRAL
jgi:long-chain acyl-CoA synthetase